MKKLFGLFLLLCTSLAFAGADDINFSQRNSTDTGNINRIPAHPTTPGLLAYDSSTLLPVWVTLGSSLSINSGVLTAAPAAPFNFGTPNARTLTVGTAFQATDPTKAAIVTISPQCTAAMTISGGSTCTMQARVGTSGLTCSSGTVVAQWTNGNTGTLTIGLALNQTVGSPGSINLPIGGFGILCATSGTFTVPAAVDQSAGN